MKNNNLSNFINYIKTPISREEILSEFTKNNIRYDRCILYSDFIQSLIHLIFDTYLGGYITDKNERINHFRWCWNTNANNFKEEGLNVENKEIYSYFLTFMTDEFYSLDEKDQNASKTEILKLWLYIFDYDNLKSVYDLDTLIELYENFEKASCNGTILK